MLAVKTIDTLVEIGRRLQDCDQTLEWLIDHEWWEAYQGQTDDEIIITLTHQMYLYAEIDTIIKELAA